MIQRDLTFMVISINLMTVIINLKLEALMALDARAHASDPIEQWRAMCDADRAVSEPSALVRSFLFCSARKNPGATSTRRAVGGQCK